jgi:hypothetical protein
MYNSLPKARSIQQIISDHNQVKRDVRGKADSATISHNLKIIKTKNINRLKAGLAASTKSGADESTKTQTTKKYKVITLRPDSSAAKTAKKRDKPMTVHSSVSS